MSSPDLIVAVHTLSILLSMEGGIIIKNIQLAQRQKEEDLQGDSSLDNTCIGVRSKMTCNYNLWDSSAVLIDVSLVGVKETAFDCHEIDSSSAWQYRKHVCTS